MIALDTNVLVYAHDTREPTKRDRARVLLASGQQGVLLWQVAVEFVGVSRKILRPHEDVELVWERLDEIRGWFPLIAPSERVIERARDLMRRHQVQFWDAMIYAGCAEAGVDTLYSEDLPGEAIEGLTIINPFASVA